MDSLKHIEQKQKESLTQTLGNRLWIGLEELMRTIGFSEKNKKAKQTDDPYQISENLEKFEKKLITKRPPTLPA